MLKEQPTLEPTMDPEVKEALEALVGAIEAINGRLDKMSEDKPADEDKPEDELSEDPPADEDKPEDEGMKAELSELRATVAELTGRETRATFDAAIPVGTTFTVTAEMREHMFTLAEANADAFEGMVKTNAVRPKPDAGETRPAPTTPIPSATNWLARLGQTTETPGLDGVEVEMSEKDRTAKFWEKAHANATKNGTKAPAEYKKLRGWE